MSPTSPGTTVRRPAARSKKQSGDAATKAARIARQKSAIRKIMARYPNALKELAK